MRRYTTSWSKMISSSRQLHQQEHLLAPPSLLTLPHSPAQIHFVPSDITHADADGLANRLFGEPNKARVVFLVGFVQDPMISHPNLNDLVILTRLLKNLDVAAHVPPVLILTPYARVDLDVEEAVEEEAQMAAIDA